ncbi:MAG: zinc-ribbon domain-containing protein [Actinobacteria bacterium]|nr:zinc-ribbon domain-containing protein [Actinomycetota bacterium]
MADGSPKPQKELGKHKTQLRKLEREKEKAFPGLGMTAYQAFLEGRITEESLVSACGSIKDIDTQIEQENAAIESLKAEIEQLKALKKKPGAICPNCGAPMEAGARFCPNCGHAPAPAINVCASCGTPLSPGARFCGNCGNPTVSGPAAPQPLQPEAPAAPPPAQTLQQPPAPPGYAPPPPPPPGTQATDSGGTVEEKQEKKCPSCFAIIIEEDALFCGECGTRLG